MEPTWIAPKHAGDHDYLLAATDASQAVQVLIRQNHIDEYRVKFQPGVFPFGLSTTRLSKWFSATNYCSRRLLGYERVFLNRQNVAKLLEYLQNVKNVGAVKFQVVSVDKLMAAFAEGESNNDTCEGKTQEA